MQREVTGRASHIPIAGQEVVMVPREKHDSGRSSVTTDRLFAPAPHGLIADEDLSYAAFRLWCVLHRLAWLREPPEIDRLCQEMRQGERAPDRRSVYRWLSELESHGWLDWRRTPGKANNNRFVVRSEQEPMTLRSEDRIDDHQPVIVESQPVIVESQPVIVESQVPPIHPVLEQAKSSSQNHEIYLDHDDDGDGRTRAKKQSEAKSIPSHVAYLFDQGMGAAPEFAHLDGDAAISDFDARRSDGQSVAHIVKQWRQSPPKRGAIYGRPVQSKSPPDQRGRSPVATRPRGSTNPTGGAELKNPGWMDKLIKQAENGEL
jgi:hypothetical protein